MPTTVLPGELLLVGFTHISSSTAEPTDWDLIITTQHTSGATINVFGKIAVGDEDGTTVDFVTAVTRRASAQCYRISNWHGTTLPEAAGATGADSNPDAPNLSPSWGNEETLWIPFACLNTSQTVVTYPTNYTDGVDTVATGTQATTIASARRLLATASENPGPFESSGSANWAAATVAIRSAPFDNLVKFGLTDSAVPDVDTDHVLRVRARLTDDTNDITMRSRVMEGSSEIARRYEDLTSESFTTFVYELLEAEAALIGVYNDLEAWIDVLTTAGTIEVSWVNLQIPQPDITAVGDTTSLLWDILAAVGDNLELQWDLKTAIGDQIGLLWDIRSAIGDQLGLLWDQRSATGDEASLLWDLHTNIADTLALIWDIHTPIGDELVIRYDIASAMGDDLILRWDQATTISDQIGLLWDLYAAVNDQIGLLWDLRAALADQVDLRWDLAFAQGDTIQLVWDVADATGVVGDAIALLWDVRTAVGDSNVLQWDIFNASGDAISLLWDLHVNIGDMTSLLWDLRQLATDELGLRWDVGIPVGDAISLLWDQFHIVRAEPFPIVESVTQTIFDADTTSHLVEMPPSTVDGQLLIIVIVTFGSTGTITTPDDWSVLAQEVVTGLRLSSFIRTSDGTEGGTTVDVVTSVARKAVAHVYQVSSWAGVEAVDLSNGTTDLPDPPALAPSWGSAKTLWLTASAGADSDTVDSYPTDYTNGIQGQTSEPNGVYLASARRNNQTASENPGPFDMSSSAISLTQTIGIRPALADMGLTVRWDQRNLVTDELSLLWDLSGPVGVNTALLWDILEASGEGITLRWDIFNASFKTVQVLWDLSAAVGDSLEMQWDLIGQAGKSLGLEWSALQSAGDQLELLWDLRIVASDQIEFDWDLRAAAGDSLSILWDVAGGDEVVGNEITFLWFVQQSFDVYQYRIRVRSKEYADVRTSRANRTETSSKEN
jgi:hypothetical protein